MPISIFFGKFLGLYIAIMSLAMLINQKYFKNVCKEVLTSPAMSTFAGIISLLFGLFVVLLHNIWEGNWTLIVTILGWLILIKGLLYVFFPLKLKGFCDKLMKSPAHTWMLWILLIVGLLLVYLSFFTAQAV